MEMFAIELLQLASRAYPPIGELLRLIPPVNPLAKKIVDLLPEVGLSETVLAKLNAKND